MVVMIVGATGFIGEQLARAFFEAGHEVVCASRSRPDPMPRWCGRHEVIDYSSMPTGAELQQKLVGVDVLINAVGILRERKTQTFEAIHVMGPSALFMAAAKAGVRRVVQISALGADADAVSGYHRTKHAADLVLMKQPVDWLIVQPSLVYGPGGTSARLFELLATLPIIPLPAGGRQQVQPVHVGDLVEAVVRLALSPAALQYVLTVAGPKPIALRDFLQQLRGALGLPGARTLAVPAWLVRFGARLGDHLPFSMLDSETLGMLERGNTGDAARFQRVLTRPALSPNLFLTPAERDARRASASLQWLKPVLRLAVAMMWFIAAVVSMGLYPRADSLALLQSIGIPSAWTAPALYSAIAIDFVFGVLTLLPARRALWTAQLAVVLGYTLIITWRLPHLWLEPFGPVAKNLPILALIWTLRELEVRR